MQAGVRLNNSEYRGMKRRRLLLLSVLVVALLAGGGLWVWQAKRQYMLNRQLIATLLSGDKQALALINAGADPNTHYYAEPPPILKQMLNERLHRVKQPANHTPTAFLIACGAQWYEHSSGLSMSADTYPEEVPLGSVKVLVPDYAGQPIAKNGKLYIYRPLVRAMLAHGADYNATDLHKWTALHGAIWSHYPHIAQLLLEHGAKVNVQEEDGSTPLLLAASLREVDMVRLLINQGADVSMENTLGDTPLHFAVSDETELDIARMLLAHGADPNHPSKQGITPLKYAQDNHIPTIVTLLRKEESHDK